jgi:N-methylhydantoinase A
MFRIAFDIGGTFTDVVLEDTRSGQLELHKVLSTPTALHEGVLSGLDSLLAGKVDAAPGAAISAADVSSILHATTIATNAILERRGAPTALITTRGFRDVLLIGRQKRYDTYDLYLRKPEPLAQRRHIFEIDERVDADGTVVRELDADSVNRAIDAIQEAGLRSVAVALMHAYANPAHETAVAAQLAQRAPQLAVSLSADVSPKIREYERTNTTVANAYVKPLVDQYLARLEQALASRGLPTQLSVMQSNGGLASMALARRYPVRIVESGPAAGVMMCAAVGRRAGFAQLLTFDMGGTTAKLGAIDDGAPVVTPTFEVDNRHFRKFSGLPLNVPAIELLEIGAGGGSIASVEMGLIRVGPASAGADPGPLCYLRGGEQPTVTDANLVLGYLNPLYFNGGAIGLDVDAARDGVERVIAKPLDISIGEAAWGIHAIANSNMETAMRVVSIERGRDPRKYALVAFGGAGPLHAARLARALGIPQVMVPSGAGVGSAIGLLHASPRIDLSVTRILPLHVDRHEDLAAIYAELMLRARTELAELGSDAPPRFLRYAYMRHQGQGFEIKVDLPDGPIDHAYVERAAKAFFDSYARRYGYRDSETAIEGVDWQLAAILPNAIDDESPAASTPSSTPAASPRAQGAAASSIDTIGGAIDSAIVGQRQAYFPEAGGFVQCPIIDRYRMRADESIAGPAIVEERECTTVILPDDRVRRLHDGHLLIDIKDTSPP